MLQSHRAARATAPVRDEILYYCRESVRAGLNFNAQSNISVRLSDEAFRAHRVHLRERARRARPDHRPGAAQHGAVRKGPVPVMPFEFSTHAEFGRRSADLMGDTVNAVVWANHGLLAVGTTLELAFKVAVAVEDAEVLHHASLAGVPNVLVYDRIAVPGAPACRVSPASRRRRAAPARTAPS